MESTPNTRKALTDCSLCEQTAALSRHYAPCPDCMKILMAPPARGGK